MLSYLKSIKRKAIRLCLGSKLVKHEISKNKTEWWQSEEGAEYFVTGSDPVANSITRYTDELVNQAFLRHCGEKSRILDVGSGHGILSTFLAQHEHIVCATDISDALLSRIKDPSIRKVRADARSLPFPDGEFDVVTARMFLPHFPDWDIILKEMVRCCSLNGKIVVHATSRENSQVVRNDSEHCDFGESEDINGFKKTGRPFYAAMSGQEIEIFAKKNRLKVIAREPVTFFHQNRAIGKSLGKDRYSDFQRDLIQMLNDPASQRFAQWLDTEVIRHMPPWISYYNLLVLQKTT